MNTKLYTLSFLEKTRKPVLKRRPWWNLLGKDSIVMEDSWSHRYFADIPKEEADILINASQNYWNTTAGRLFVRLLGPIQQVQLEENPQVTSYIQTTGHHVDRGAVWESPNCTTQNRVDGEAYWVGARRVANLIANSRD